VNQPARDETPPGVHHDGGMPESDGSLLITWLRLLGWVVSVRPDEGHGWVGVARHEDGAGGSLQLEASAAARGEVAWQLFSGALGSLDRGSTRQAA